MAAERLGKRGKSHLMTEHAGPERAVLAANAQFYRAFNLGDSAEMSALWAARSPVACLHPGESLLLGRQLVLDRWREILALRPPFTLRCNNPVVQILGSTALVCCYEGADNSPAHLAATNVFVYEDERWRMVHHHAGPLAAPLPLPNIGHLN